MAELHEIRTLLEQTTAALSELQADIARFPQEKGLLINAASLQKRQRELEEDFLQAAQRQGEAVCSYRLFSEARRPTIVALSKALLDFQSVFSLIYSAMRRGPRARAVLSAESQEKQASASGTRTRVPSALYSLFQPKAFKKARRISWTGPYTPSSVWPRLVTPRMWLDSRATLAGLPSRPPIPGRRIMHSMDSEPVLNGTGPQVPPANCWSKEPSLKNCET